MAHARPSPLPAQSGSRSMDASGYENGEWATTKLIAGETYRICLFHSFLILYYEPTTLGRQSFLLDLLLVNMWVDLILLIELLI
jgi:hypothetical protein